MNIETSDTWSSAIKIEVPIISFFDRARLSFTPLQVKETEDGTVYYKIDSKGRLYIYDIYLKKKEVRHYAFDTDLKEKRANCEEF